MNSNIKRESSSNLVSEVQRQPSYGAIPPTYIHPSVETTSYGTGETTPILTQVHEEYSVQHAYYVEPVKKRHCCCQCILIFVGICLFLVLAFGILFAIRYTRCHHPKHGLTDQLFNLTLPASSITISIDAGEMSMVKSNVSNNYTLNFYVTTTAASQSALNDISVTAMSGEDATFSVAMGTGWWDYIWNCQRCAVTAMLPYNSDGTTALPHMVVDVNDEIHLKSVRLDSMKINSNNGDVVLTDVIANKLTIASDNGDVRGNVTLIAPTCTLNLQTNDGNVDLSNVLFANSTGSGNPDDTTLHCSLDFVSHNGDMEIETEDFIGDFDIRATAGKLDLSSKHSIEFTANTDSHRAGTLGEVYGQMEVMGKTDNGNIDIRLD
eukprot:GCRY01005070.1.p1 GENE.GCRY01005070.1~~GCRY01005070.1.p1  ORF type:complete len:379 (-),score=60.11 GCRY01005070.1:67-1203(-)